MLSPDLYHEWDVRILDLEPQSPYRLLCEKDTEATCIYRIPRLIKGRLE